MESKLKIGQKCNPRMLKELGYEKLSQTTWKRDNLKIQLINNKIKNITFITKFSQLIQGFRGSGISNIHSKEIIKCLR